MWRIASAGIHVDSDAVTVATTFSSHRVSWQEIDHFAVLPRGRYPYVGHVVLRDGRTLATYGLSTSGRMTERNRLAIERPINNLNAILADWRKANTGLDRSLPF